MKIACVGTGWYPEQAGGLEKYLYGMSRELTRGGDDVTLFVTGKPVSWDERAHVGSLGDPRTPTFKRLLQAQACFAERYREPYDVLNVHFALYALPLLPRVSKQTPTVFNFQGPWAQESRVEGGGALSAALKYQLERFVYGRMDRFVTLSSAFKKTLADSYGIPEDRITVIPLGIDTSFFSPAHDRAAVRRSLGWPLDKKVIFTARRLVRRVGVVELLEAAEKLKAANIPVAVKIAGAGPLAQELRDSIDRNGLRDVVELLGFVSDEDLVRSYQAADMTVLPSQALEGFGTTITESLACGTPVLATPVGGMPEVLSPLDANAIARSPSAEDIAEILGRACTGALLLPSAEACRNYAVATSGWNSVCARLREVFALAGEDRQRLQKP